MLPSAVPISTAPVSGGISSASSSSNTRDAQAKAFCSSVMTPEISLNGLVYWLA